jgi:hypothetical protein
MGQYLESAGVLQGLKIRFFFADYPLFPARQRSVPNDVPGAAEAEVISKTFPLRE